MAAAYLRMYSVGTGSIALRFTIFHLRQLLLSLRFHFENRSGQKQYVNTCTARKKRRKLHVQSMKKAVNAFYVENGTRIGAFG